MRFRKSVKILPGVRVNFSKSGVSTTVGVKGLSINTGKKGSYLNTGIPGTGLYDRKKIGGGSSRSGTSNAAAIREAKRVQREIERKQKEIDRLNELQRAALEVQAYENYINRLQSIHKDCADVHNWLEIATSAPPLEVKPDGPPIQRTVDPVHDEEKYYTNLIDNYKPNFFARLFKWDKRKLKKWNSLLESGRLADEQKTLNLQKAAREEYENATQKYQADCVSARKEFEEALEAHKRLIELARRINSGDTDAYAIVLEDLDPFNEISEFGSDIDCTICSPKRAKAVITVHDDTVIPKQAKSLLKSGKLSVKDLPVGRFNEIYQDYVCSASLRIARDLFAILPFDEIIVTTTGRYLDKSTGNEEEGPILSVLFDRPMFMKLNFDALDPSDSMSNFKCNMAFKKNQGMVGTEEIDFDT